MKVEHDNKTRNTRSTVERRHFWNNGEGRVHWKLDVYINFLGFLKQITTNQVTYNYRSLFFHSSGGWSPKLKCWPVGFLMRVLFLACRFAFSLCSHRAPFLGSPTESRVEGNLISLLKRTLFLPDHGSTFMIPFNLITSLMASSPNIATLWVQSSICKLCRDGNIQSKTLPSST